MASVPQSDGAAVPPSEQRREASAWQGGARPRYPEASVEHAAADLRAAPGDYVLQP